MFTQTIKFYSVEEKKPWDCSDLLMMDADGNYCEGYYQPQSDEFIIGDNYSCIKKIKYWAYLNDIDTEYQKIN